ncbi:TetR/AcrR family transcriptional regulator [Svornostia abyssi]|jgi:AcrR family transcriptional regulator|uniref:TetR/AcrR family transcriptional regulator n=1 Tax=Svornostia abyssi TaxID=2898438 RepID=A0ABY5PKQ2_9ACTN|nr:TetR/AcrR family transcriptional regulator [Parviterribacteraceae bacterium J379]
MRAEGVLTPKGQRRAQEILEATLRCLARDGYAITSMQRVADEAGVGKRAVVYYFSTREGLFEHVIRYVGGRLVDRLEEAIHELDDPADIVEKGFEIIWSTITTDRALLVAWFGLQAESITNPELRAAASYIVGRLDGLVARIIDSQTSRGSRLRIDRNSLRVLVLANVQGLILYYLDRGATPELNAAIADFQRFLTNVAVPVDDLPLSRALILEGGDSGDAAGAGR